MASEPAEAPSNPCVKISTSMVRCCGGMSSVSGAHIPRCSSPTVNLVQGDFAVELYDKHAPKTCKNFLGLVQRGYYNGVAFHRIISVRCACAWTLPAPVDATFALCAPPQDFMIQGGDPTGTGRGGESIYGGPFDDEISPDLKHTGAGILSMANSGPNTNRSQFFITLAPTSWLDGKHTIFGRVASGMKTIEKMGMVQTDASDKPKEPVTIKSATVIEHADLQETTLATSS